MPIKRMLAGRNFSPESAAILVKAFDSLVAELGLRSQPEREQAAKVIIGLAAGQTVLDAARLRDEGASLMRAELLGAKST